jgi:pyruvate dehydrogenase E2 component (dihydrolipoamide acetyltransferase)
MVYSVQTAPHITFSVEIDMSLAEAWREQVNASLLPDGQAKVSLTALILKACGWTLLRHPWLNASIQKDQVLLHRQVNIGMAVALEAGLIVPVIHDVPRKGVGQISTEASELARRARENRLQAGQLSGGTFTVSNLGMFGVDSFTAILNPPQAGILAVGRVARRFVPGPDDQPLARPMMSVTLSADHRIVDGALAARFLADLRICLENPSLMLL